MISPVLQKAYGNLNTTQSIDSIDILKKFIKEKGNLEGNMEDDDELCKRMNRNVL